MSSYYLEFILNTHNNNAEFIRNSLAEFDEHLEVVQLSKNETEKGEYFKINISTLDPASIFDACAQFGRIKSVKIEERS